VAPRSAAAGALEPVRGRLSLVLVVLLVLVLVLSFDDEYVLGVLMELRDVSAVVEVESDGGAAAVVLELVEDVELEAF
jgi:hypothetical protein